MYKINELSKLAGISTRTLRHYDSINLLSPTHIGDNKYRYYSDKEVDLLQQILFYKELGFPLNEIKTIIDSDDFNFLEALMYHKEKLETKQGRITKLIETINKTIQKERGEVTMSNNEKFESLKENMIKENDHKYGKEITEKYGKDTIEASYNKMRKMSKWEFKEAERLGKEINEVLADALKTNNHQSNEAKKVCELHQKWIKMYWPTYSEEAHLSLVKMYTEDERFKSYYEKVGKGATDFLYRAMKMYLKKTTK